MHSEMTAMSFSAVKQGSNKIPKMQLGRGYDSMGAETVNGGKAPQVCLP